MTPPDVSGKFSSSTGNPNWSSLYWSSRIDAESIDQWGTSKAYPGLMQTRSGLANSLKTVAGMTAHNLISLTILMDPGLTHILGPETIQQVFDCSIGKITRC